MKNKFFLSVVFLVTLLFSAFSGNAQQTKKVIVVVNKAGWCPVCQANGEKMMKEVIPAFNESNVMFIMNDLTNDAAKSDSKMKLDEAKVYDAVKKINATGLLLLVDPETGKLLEKISVAESAEKLIKTIKNSSMSRKEKM